MEKPKEQYDSKFAPIELNLEETSSYLHGYNKGLEVSNAYHAHVIDKLANVTELKKEYMSVEMNSGTGTRRMEDILEAISNYIKGGT